MGKPLKALLAAAGLGARLRPLTDALPKCLMPIDGRPLLGLWLDRLRGAGVEEIVVNLHHHADLVREYVERSPHARAVTLSFEPALLGTGGTLLYHRDRFADAPVLFAHADNVSVFDPARLLADHLARPSGTVMTMMTFDTDTPEQCGIVQLDEAGRVTSFHEKPQTPAGRLANAAVYVVEPEVIGALAALGKPAIDFSTEMLPRLIGRIFASHNSLYHCDIGTLASLSRAQLEYPLVAPAPAENGDPWFGLMHDAEGALARRFRRAIDAAFAAAPLERDARTALESAAARMQA